MIKMKLSDENDVEINKLYIKQFGKNLPLAHLPRNVQPIIFGLYDNKKLVGYAICNKINSKTVNIKWIYAPHYGIIFINKMERYFKKHNITRITLNFFISKNESKIIVIKRTNFYFLLGFRIIDIKFTSQNEITIYVEKLL